MQRAVNAGIVIVISAGNDGTIRPRRNPDPFALIPAQHFPGMVIIAGSVGVSNGAGDVEPALDFSNRAGTGAHYYLAALGYRDRAPDQTGAQFLWSGTSFSAPTISGAVALIAQAFPNLTGKQIVDILFHSADDLGAAGSRLRSTATAGSTSQRAFQPSARPAWPDSKTPVTGIATATCPPAAGDAANGAVARRDHPRRLQPRLRRSTSRRRCAAPTSTIRCRARCRTTCRSPARQAGPISIAMTVSERHDLAHGFELERHGDRPRGRAQGAADRRLGGRPARQQDRGRVRLCRRSQGDGAPAERAQRARS